MPENTMRIGRHMPGTRLDRLVTQKVTEILDAMPDAPGRRDRRGVQIRAFQRWKAYRAGPLQARLTAKAGTLELKVPKLKGVLFESAVVERYRRCEESVEEALTDVCMAGVSTRQVDDISQLP